MRPSRFGDLLAIPLFLLAVIYFAKKEVRTMTEDALLLFSTGGLVADFAFVTGFLE
jgi:hypothetical protein